MFLIKKVVAGSKIKRHAEKRALMIQEKNHITEDPEEEPITEDSREPYH